jgi:ornithine carbamoyltransferase
VDPQPKGSKSKHLRVIADLSPEDAREVLDLAHELKAQRRKGQLSQALAGRTVGLIFHKPSLRTRVSFEVALTELGASGIYLTQQELGLGSREAVKDAALVLSRYLAAIVIRTFEQENVDGLARYATIPVINALTDHEHPCQALGDFLTIEEQAGKLAGVRLAYMGDANNVARSLASLSLRLGVDLVVASPPGYQLSEEFLTRARAGLEEPLGNVTLTDDPIEGVREADFVYTDVWASMGQEAELEERKRIFGPYQVNDELMSHAPEETRVMHCLPAKRGLEITDSVIDGPRAIVYDQAENRLHAQKALLQLLLAPTRAG